VSEIIQIREIRNSKNGGEHGCKKITACFTKRAVAKQLPFLTLQKIINL